MVDGPRYRLLERLGQGGMATVWRAEDRQLGREVAVKVLLPVFADRPAAQERFFREARALATIRHPNVLQLFDFLPASDDEPARLVMERLHGPSLQRFFVDAGTPLPELAALVGADIGAGLVAVHARGIVHRDVKPENVLLDEGRVVLTDFGIARVQALDGAPDGALHAALTQTGDIIGSPAYMSPEQARGDEVDAASDQFSLGSLLYWLASGRAPFAGPHPLVVMQKIDRVEVVPLGACNPRVPAWLDRVVRRCHARAPRERYPDMAALVAALRGGLADDGFGDPTVELRAYFASPPSWNGSVASRVVPVRLADAERALVERRRARALASAERVLQLEPEHPRARLLVRKLTTGRSRVRAAAVALAGVAVLAVPLALRTKPVATPVAAPLLDVARAPAVRSTSTRVPVEPPVLPVATLVVKKPRTSVVAAQGTATLVAPAVVAAVVAEPVVAPPPGTLSVRTSPWCDLAVDGKSIGRTPQSVVLPAGEHHLRCTNPSGGLLVRTVTLSAGEHQAVEARLDAQALVAAHLVRGDAVWLDEQPVRGAIHVAAGRHRVLLQRDGTVIDTRWLDVPASGCALFDQPELRCDRP